MLVTGAARAEDKESQLLDYVRANLPPGYSLVVDDFRYKDFPSDGSGRMSVAGQMVLDVDLLAKMRRRDSALGYPDWPFLKKRLTARGYTDVAEVQRALKTFGMGQQFNNTLFEYAVIMPKGFTVPFEAELPYIETVSGIRLSGRLQYEKVPGLLPQDVREPHYVTGTSRSYQLIGQVADEIERQRAAFADNMRAVAKHFSNPLILQGRDNGPLVGVTIPSAKGAADTSTWSVSSSSSGPILVQNFTATGIALQAFALSGTNFKEGDAVEVTVGVRMAKLKPFVDQASVYLSITHPDGTVFDLAGSAFPLQPWQNGHARSWIQLLPDPSAPTADATQPQVAAMNEANPIESDHPDSFEAVLWADVWAGQVNDPVHGPYSVEFAPTEGGFSVHYPEIGCRGFWYFQDVTDQKAVLLEDITEAPTQACGSGGLVILERLSDTEVSYARWDSDMQENCCTATLSAKKLETAAAAGATGAGEAKAEFQTELLSATWEGPVSQPGARPYTVSIVPNNGMFDISYPELNCGGTWTFQSVGRDRAELAEKITWGSGCGRGGFVTLSRNFLGEVTFEWFDRPGGGRCCTGKLTAKE
ncbi:MAG: hypothetical protein AAGM21_09895 [Pseudomonadota bacterium]